MSSSESPASWRKAASLLWFPVFFAIVMPVAFQAAFHQPAPDKMQIAVVGNGSQARLLTSQLHRVGGNGIDVRRDGSAASAAAAVRGRKVAAAYVAGDPGVVYVARAASSIQANYVQQVFANIAAQAGTRPAPIRDVVPLASGDGGNGAFFFVFPLMMIGLIASLVVLQLPAWGIGRRAVVVAAVGALGSLVAYLTVADLPVLPSKPLLLVYAFLLTQVYGQLMVGAAPLLKQYFLPFSMSIALILSVPSSGGTVPPDLLPTFFHDLSYALPLAQGVKITRGVAYFHDAGIAQATLVLALWAAVAVATVAVSWVRQSRARLTAVERAVNTNAAGRAARAPAPSAT